MADIARLLDTMHPLREPPAPEAIAPSLILLALGCATAGAVFLLMRWARRRRGALQRSAQAALASSSGLDRDERLAAQAQLLRRLVRALAGDDAARAQGDAWLAALDRVFATQFFTGGAGKVFGGDLYRRPRDVDIEGLDRSLHGLIAKVRA